MLAHFLQSDRNRISQTVPSFEQRMQAKDYFATERRRIALEEHMLSIHERRLEIEQKRIKLELKKLKLEKKKRYKELKRFKGMMGLAADDDDWGSIAGASITSAQTEQLPGEAQRCERMKALTAAELVPTESKSKALRRRSSTKSNVNIRRSMSTLALVREEPEKMKVHNNSSLTNRERKVSWKDDPNDDFFAVSSGNHANFFQEPFVKSKMSKPKSLARHMRDDSSKSTEPSSGED